MSSKEKIKALTITKTGEKKGVCAGRGSSVLNRFRSHLNEPREWVDGRLGKNYFIGKNANTGNHSSSSSYGLGVLYITAFSPRSQLWKSQPWHHWQLGPDHSLLWQIVLCTANSLSASTGHQPAFLVHQEQQREATSKHLWILPNVLGEDGGCVHTTSLNYCYFEVHRIYSGVDALHKF